MDDLTITRLCARAAGVNAKKGVSADGQAFLYLSNGDLYDPLHNHAQNHELVERLRLDIYHFRAEDGTEMVQISKAFDQRTDIDQVAPVSDFLRAICLCAARVQQSKENQK